MVDKDERKGMIVRIDTELYRKLAHHLIDVDKTQQDWLTDAVYEKLDREQKKVRTKK